MATYNKGSAGGGYGAKDLAGPKVWAVYPHWEGTVDTKRGASRAIRAEVYELTEGGAAVRFGAAVFFQTVFLKLPLEEWSVGVCAEPTGDRRYYDFPYPEGIDDVVNRCMAGLPEHPELPEEPFPDKPTSDQVGSDNRRNDQTPSYQYDEEPF
jgi:hypothetical protein